MQKLRENHRKWNNWKKEKRMHGVLVVNQKINLGAMGPTCKVNLPQKFLKQMNQKRLPWACASNQRILPTAMGRM